jgi:hypothetical protein
MGSYDLTTVRGTPAYSTSAPKFGTHNKSTGFVLGRVGNDSFLSAGLGAALGTGTFEGWIKTTSASGTFVAFGHDDWFWVGINGTNLEAHYGPTLSEQVLTGSAVNDGNWHHVAIVFNAAAGTLYLDGNRQGSTGATKNTDVGSSTFNGFCVGGFGSGGTLPTFDFPGSIDEVCVSTVARYSGATYTVPTSAFDPTVTANIRALYHLDNNGVDSGQVPIVPTDANIHYSPFNWDVTSVRAKTINPGAYFKVLLQASGTVGLTFDTSADLTPLPEISYRVDGDGWTVATVASTINISLPTSSGTEPRPWGNHLIEVAVKSETETRARWVTQSTGVSFTGIVGGATVASTLIKDLNVLAYGTSITEGVRTIDSTATNDTDRNDSTAGFAFQIGESLGADVGVVGFGGSGLTVTGSGSVPVITSTYNLLWGSGPSRSFTSPIPDVIVIEQGTNDGSTSTVAAYTSLLNSLLSATPATTVILCLRPLNGAAQASNIQAAVAACSTPSRVTYVNTAGWFSSADSSDALHPYGYASPQIARLVTTQIRTAFASRGPLFFKSSGGVATTVSPYRG